MSVAREIVHTAVGNNAAFGSRGSLPMSDELVELEGSHRHPVAGAERVCSVAPGEEMTVTVFVRRNPDARPVADPAAEARKHPRDRLYLSPSEVEASFGAAPADLQAVVDYAESRGLRPGAVSTATRSVRITGRPERWVPLSVSSLVTSGMVTSPIVAGSAR